jgi:HEAT repeat protein
MPRVLSENTRLLIESLYKPASLWNRSTKHRLATLGLIGQAREPIAIPDLALLLLSRNKDIAQATARVVSALGYLLKPGELPWLDQVMRARSPYRWSYPSAWADLNPRRLDHLNRLSTISAFPLGLASFHFSGYVRERALRLLGGVFNGTELPFLLLRLNDWVPQVRSTAEGVIRARLKGDYARFFIQDLVLITRLQSTYRARRLELIGAIEALLKTEDGIQAVVAGMDSPDMQVRRQCYRLALGSSLDQHFVVEKALTEADPVIRLWGAENLARVPAQTASADVLSRLRGDRLAAVRRQALQVSCERFPEAAQPWVDNALLDPHPAVRGYAQKLHLRKHSAADVRQYYVDALGRSDPRSVFSALSGLGEIGNSSDVELILPYVSHDVAKVRRASIRSIARLQTGGFVDLFAQHLSDPTASVSREAMKALGKSVHLLKGERIWQVFNSAARTHSRRNALCLIARLSKWESIVYLIEALCTEDLELQGLAKSYVRRWQWRFNRSFTAPTAEQAKSLSRAMARCGAFVEQPVKELLEFSIRAF